MIGALRRRVLLAVTLFLGLACLAASGFGCGKKADPVPPTPKAAQAPAPQEEDQAEKKPPEVETGRRLRPLPAP